MALSSETNGRALEDELRRARAQLNTTRGAKKALEKEREKLLDKLKESQQKYEELERKMQEGSMWRASTSILGDSSESDRHRDRREEPSNPGPQVHATNQAWRKKLLELEDDNHALAERVVKLEARIRSHKAKKRNHGDVAQLEVVRERLLLEVQEQEGEIERLTSENTALQHALDEERAQNGHWRKHVKRIQAQNEHLKELLAEGIEWQREKQERPQTREEEAQPRGSTVQPPSASSREEELMQQLEKAVGYSEELKVVLADKQYKLLKAKEDTSRLRRAYGPILSGIESHLLEVVTVKTKQ